MDDQHCVDGRRPPSTDVNALKIEHGSILSAFTPVDGRKRAWCERARFLACVPYRRRRPSTSVDARLCVCTLSAIIMRSGSGAEVLTYSCSGRRERSCRLASITSAAYVHSSIHGLLYTGAINLGLHGLATSAATSNELYHNKHTRLYAPSSSVLLLHKPTTKTYFSNRAFRSGGPSVWNSLNS